MLSFSNVLFIECVLEKNKNWRREEEEKKKEEDRIRLSFFLLLFFYAHLCLTEDDGEKRDATNTPAATSTGC